MTLYRPSHAMIGGVAAGLARALNLDVTWVRLAFVLAVVFGGSGIGLYLLLWAVIPRETGGTIAEESIAKAKRWHNSR